jgi:signal transduction histidine kinase
VPELGVGSEVAAVLAPHGRDAQLTMSLLAQAEVVGVVSSDLPDLCKAISSGIGFVIVAEEALTSADPRQLFTLLSSQPPWSDLPIILLTRRGGGPERNPAAARAAELLGNVTFLERPFHPTTFASLARSAVRARRKQYEARTRMTELSALTATLEHRIEERTMELVAEISAREKAQAQLLQSQKVESLGHLTGGVAHDFNNLLMAVMGNLDLLRKRHQSDERSLRLLNAALEGAKRGAVLTQRMLAFARQQDLRPVSVNLGNMLHGMRSLIDSAIPAGIAVRFDVPPSLPPVQADLNQLELAILNLCINARDAMPEGGTITISVRRGKPSPVPGSSRLVQLAVTDTGTGMDENTLKKAIDPFFSTKPIGKGTGLGLSSVHGLATQLGGKLDLQSEEGIGTTATLWLPEAKDAQLLTTSDGFSEDATVGLVRPATILVVDDDALIAMSTVGMLEDLGHKVIEAHSGQRALEIIETGRSLDLLVTDHAMPGMTGLQLAEIVRERRPNLPILLATGYAEAPEGSSIRLPRLAKPYQQAQLNEQINRLLAKSDYPTE